MFPKNFSSNLIFDFRISESGSREGKLNFIIGLDIHQNGVSGGSKTKGEKEPRR